MSELPSALLSLPAPGDRTVARLRRKVRLVALRRLLGLSGEGLPRRGVHALRLIQGRVEAMARKHPEVVLSAVGSPDVIAPLLVLESGLRSEAEVVPHLVPALLVGLARDPAALEEALVWEAPIGRVAHPCAGWLARFDPPAKAMLADPAGLAVEQQDGTRIDLPPDAGGSTVTIEPTGSSLGAAPLGLRLSLHDGNPISMDEAHPDKAGNAVSLGDRPLEEWQTALDEALSLIELALPTWHEEIGQSLDRIVPVGFEPEMHLSASYREAPGTVYMTLHPDPVTLAEAIVHEAQHGKLNLLSWLDPVLDNGYTEWSESPVRPDLRPIMGVLLAVHAFVPVAALHHALQAADHPLSRTPRFSERQQQVLAGNKGGLEILRQRAQPTALGGQVLAGLEQLHAFLADAEVPLPEGQLPPG